MQIEAIAIYRGNESRVVRFRLGQLSVVTGWPATGKSALLEIAEYCLGRTEPGFARGALDVVEWYGLLLNHEGTRVFIGRPAPRLGAASSQSAMIALGVDDVTEPSQLVSNADSRSVRETLASMLGIAGELTGRAEGTEPQPATLGQALLLSFQSQGEIANPDQLFHRVNEPFVGQALRDALPYFLGAVDASYVARRQRLIEVRRELRKASRELDELEAIQTESAARATALVSLAVAAGMLSAEQLPAAGDIATLRAVLASAPLAVEPPTGALVEEERLRIRRRELANELRRVQEQRMALRDVRAYRGQFEAELSEQRSRLETLDLLGYVDSGDSCPVCGQELESADASTIDLRNQIAGLEAQLAAARELEWPRRRVVQQLRERAREIRDELRGVDSSLVALSDAEPNLLQNRRGAEAGPFVRGRISEFLERMSIADADSVPLLQRRVEQLKTEASLLEEALSPATLESDIEARLHFVNETLTGWAHEFELEHHKDGIRVDLSNLTIVANDRRGPIPLRRIGSAANQVWYHVVAHLALHKWFVEESRPLPRFLFLDQPEQAYYPADLQGVPDASERLSDVDQQKVAQLYQFVDSTVRSMGGRFQAIIVGHWNPRSISWFDEARVADWRGQALVPGEWLDEHLDAEGRPEAG